MKNVELVGGPWDGKLLALPDDQDECAVNQLNSIPDLGRMMGAERKYYEKEKVKTLTHVYRRKNIQRLGVWRFEYIGTNDT